MTWTYHYKFSVNTGGMLKPVGDLMDSINNTMAGFGFTEAKLVTRSQCLDTKVTSQRELTKEELDLLTSTVANHYPKELPKEWEVQYEGLDIIGPHDSNDE